jgi:N-methylhydantoinase A
VIFVAVDIGSTFTDLIGFDEEAGVFLQAKSLTTPAELGHGVIDCIQQSGVWPSAITELIHASTIAINTLIERKGAKTGLVITRDVDVCQIADSGELIITVGGRQ